MGVKPSVRRKAIKLFVDKRTLIVYLVGMTGSDLEKVIHSFGLSNSEFARLAMVSPRAVQLWLNGEREIPGPVVAFVRLFLLIPEAMRAAEIAMLRNEEAGMFGGFFLMNIVGKDGDGAGMLIFDRGAICGADEGGVLYDGYYKPGRDPKTLDVELTVTVPPGTTLVTGVGPQTAQYSFDIACTIPAMGESKFPVVTPFGPVAVYFRRLRDLVRAA